jgi:hypothetical protein
MIPGVFVSVVTQHAMLVAGRLRESLFGQRHTSKVASSVNDWHKQPVKKQSVGQSRKSLGIFHIFICLSIVINTLSMADFKRALSSREFEIVDVVFLLLTILFKLHHFLFFKFHPR